MRQLAETELERIEDWAQSEDAPRYPSMSYEDGIKYMCEFLRGDMSIDELLED